MLSYYHKHRDEIMQYQKRYFQEHREQIEKRQQNYRHKNRDKIKKYYHDYYRKNKAKVLAKTRKYQAEHYVSCERARKYAIGFEVLKDGQVVKTFTTIREVCDFLGFCPTTIYEYIKKDKDFYGYKVKKLYEGEIEYEN